MTAVNETTRETIEKAIRDCAACERVFKDTSLAQDARNARAHMVQQWRANFQLELVR